MNTAVRSEGILINLLIMIALFIVCVLTAYALATQNMYLATGVVLGIAFFAIGFLSPRLSLYILIFSMLLSPEFGSRDVTGSGFTIRFEDLLLVVMGFAWLAKSAIHKEIGLAVHTRLNGPIFYYILACILATGWGIIQGTVSSPLTGVMFVLKYFEYFVVYFLTINNVNSKAQLRSLLIAMFVIYIIVVLVGFSQIPGGQRISAPFEGESGEPNTLGGYLIIMLSLNIALFLNTRSIRRQIMIVIAGFIGFIAILFTLSRASWLGMSAMYLTLVILCNRRKFLIVAMCIGLLLAPFLLPDTVIDRILYTFQKEQNMEPLTRYSISELEFMYQTHQITYDPSTMARFSSMKQSLRDFLKKPVFGYGITGYWLIDAQFNKVLIETGLVGLISFLYLLWVTGSSLFRLMKKYHHDVLYRTVTVGTFAAFCGLVVHSIGTNTFIIVRIMEPFWCLVGLCMAIEIIEEKTPATTHSLTGSAVT